MDGVLIVKKEEGYTSHDVVFKLRKILGTKKIGHSGTLDPNATGVLIVLVGRACKILPFIEDVDKEYIASLEFGNQTISDDIWDEVIATKEIVPIADFNALLQTFVGKIKQLPPMISSIKINGKKLYEYTRQNIPVERPLRDVEVYNIEVLDEVSYTFKMHCGSGTYVRSICRDVAELSGNLGCMSSLVRTKVGKFTIDQAKTLQQIEDNDYQLYDIKSMLSHYEQIAYTPIEHVYHGKRIKLDTLNDRVVLIEGDLVVAIYEREFNTTFKCVRGLF